MDVKGPVAALAVLAVADDIDAGVGLVLDDLLDRLPEAGFVGGLVVGLAILDLAQKLDQFGWPNQAADMGREDAVAGHVSPLIFSSLPGRFHITSGPSPQPSQPAWNGTISAVSERRIRRGRTRTVISSHADARAAARNGTPSVPAGAAGSCGWRPANSAPHRSCRSAFSPARYCLGIGSAGPTSTLRSAPPASVSFPPQEAPCWR